MRLALAISTLIALFFVGSYLMIEVVTGWMQTPTLLSLAVLALAVVSWIWYEVVEIVV